MTDTEFEEGDESSDGDSSDSELGNSHVKRSWQQTQTKALKTKRQKHDGDDHEESKVPRSRAVSSLQLEVEGLIRKMSLLALDDPQYGIAYYQATKLDPDVC
jgi:hypothetical protein